MNNPLRGLAQRGQSVWYDNLSRDLLWSGDLKKMIEQDGIRGVTSNPTIFEKAIGGSRIYDEDLHRLVDDGEDVYGIYESLVVRDIREAADLLLPTYEETAGADGYVSLEVSPELAYDGPGTLTQVKDLFCRVDRPNAMIKVPATPQGLAAVKDLIASGININVTLIFSLDQYRQAASAYVEGLEKLVASGGNPTRVASVASFFVSRVDTLVDERLREMADPALKSEANALMGKAAITNGKLAYASYKELFHGPAFEALRQKGARPQRVLWASTSTKNPEYPDTYYVNPLLGPETVNTMPQVLLDAYRDHGEPVALLEEGLEEARELFPELERVGINVGEVMDQLLEKGVASFADSFRKLLDGIAQKRTRLLRGWGHRSACLGNLQKRVDETLSRCDSEKVSEKLWGGYGSLWKDDPELRAQIRQRLGWLQLVETMRGETQRLRKFADQVRSSGFTDAVLLGMGGSSLASEVFASCYHAADGYLRLHVLDTTVPATILEVERSVDPARTLFIVSSKSGGTIEVISLYKYFFARMERIAGGKVGEHFIAITDPGTSLGKLASEKGFRKVFLNPPDVGGRFSALSYFGLVPAALIGADLDRILTRASQAAESAGPEVPAIENAGLWAGVILGEACAAGMDKLSLIISPEIATFGGWLEQLIAESTGKEGKGIVPVEGEPIGSPESYGNDRLFVYLRLDGDPTYDGFVSTMEKEGHPVITIRLHTAYDLGREIFRWEFATAIAGTILRINPFDQPNVQESKDVTRHLLALYQSEGKMRNGDAASITDAALVSNLRDFVGQIQPGDYFAINAFIQRTSDNLEPLQSMRTKVRDKYRVATTLGFGPRYLHSTGQIHKGGANKGIYLQITSDDPEDMPIPGEPYSFGILKASQALGDYEALKRRGRRIFRVHLSSESELRGLLEVFGSL